MNELSDSQIDPLGNIVSPTQELSAFLTVNERGFLRFGELYAGPLVAVRYPTNTGEKHVFIAFTSTNEAPHDKR